MHVRAQKYVDQTLRCNYLFKNDKPTCERNSANVRTKVNKVYKTGLALPCCNGQNCHGQKWSAAVLPANQ